jgi:hypothetical protein
MGGVVFGYQHVPLGNRLPAYTPGDAAANAGEERG